MKSTGGVGSCAIADGDLAAEGTSQAAIEREAWTSLAKVMLTSNEFLYID